MNQKVVTLRRAYETSEVTIGMLDIYGVEHDPIYTLENPWKKNKRNISSIPKGTYVCSPYSSKKYPDVFEVHNVEDRSNILIHYGNTTDDTEGCILAGLSADKLNDKPAVLQSRKAISYLRLLLGTETFILLIE